MPLLLVLVNYCTEKNLILGDGVDTYRDFMPEEPDDCIVFHEYVGDPVVPHTTHVHRSVQVKVRGKTADFAKNKAFEICKAFMSSSEDMRVDFSTEYWGQVYVRQLPFKLSQDDSDRVIYCFNLGITTNIID